ncbi:flagellar brake protein [Blastococcus xanthinilyticus]|uniref:C-di-GMP-binding flagellar brake protein YcgR n=1 Tax=Blastococcus xanthinilyticus TaxID=1564164 RepID=A0A5S5CSD3_9ACTN|nr:PilZ domain-containing protein [Blastococcus xanthinilyticus]TYP86515.1 c-di-GMP-binding flagellar brake protein YcgR [Blastococcus xanthinilyticus]
MSSVPGVDHPAEQTEAEVRLAGSNVAVSARVEVVHEGVISVRPSAGEYVADTVVQPGDPVEVFWKGDDGYRALPADVLDVQQGAVVRWRLTVTGPAEHSQRRAAVRGQVTVPVQATYGGVDLEGKTLDVSEAGIRAQFEGFGLAPEAGTTLALTIAFEDGPLRTRAEVIRLQTRATRWIMSIRFVDIPEREQDRVRRRVFQALREERARLAD